MASNLILGFDLGIDHIWWAQLMVRDRRKTWGDAGKLAWSATNVRELLQDSVGNQETLPILTVIEFPEEHRPGYGHKRNENWGGTLLSTAGELTELARGAGMHVLTPACSEIRRWAAKHMPAGQVFDWQNPDQAIADWFQGHGATDKHFARSGPLSNRDKRDAMLAAEFGAARARTN